MLLAAEIVLVFLVGATVGSFLNVCIYRLPYEKSILWPLGSYCGRCVQPIPWYDNLPLVSYWVLRGRCRKCGAPFSLRYFGIELLTALSFVGLFLVEIVYNVHQLDVLKPEAWEEWRWGGMVPQRIAMGLIPLPALFVFVFHAVLLSFLIVASVVDLDHMEIPLSVTLTGTLCGLLLGAAFWPTLPAEPKAPPVPPGARMRPGQVGLPTLQAANLELRPGVYPWPVWDKLPPWLPPDSWRTGLATGLAGMAAGMIVLRGVRFVFTVGRGIEGMGVGDIDLMMMAGAFIGWQPVVVAFFVSVLPALLFGIAHMVRRGSQELPFGPSLAAGTLLTLLGWNWVPASVKAVFFDPIIVGFFGGAGLVMLFAVAVVLRLLRGGAGQPGDAT